MHNIDWEIAGIIGGYEAEGPSISSSSTIKAQAAGKKTKKKGGEEAVLPLTSRNGVLVQSDIRVESSRTEAQNGNGMISV